MICDILIRTYYKDFEWLEYSLRSIARHCRGFRDVIVVVPASSRSRLDFRRLAGSKTITCPDYADDYLGQQVTKLSADLLTDADYICHVDADCIFHRALTPEGLFDDGKPRVLMADYRRLGRHVPWKALTERFLLQVVTHEFMRRPPYTFPRWIYSALRAHAEALHGVPLESYVMAQPPRAFSEFNALGAYAFLRHHDAFRWIDTDLDTPPEELCRTYWSWGGIDALIRQEIEGFLS